MVDAEKGMPSGGVPPRHQGEESRVPDLLHGPQEGLAPAEAREVPIKIEKYSDEEAECHACGQRGRPPPHNHHPPLCQPIVRVCDHSFPRVRRLVAP